MPFADPISESDTHAAAIASAMGLQGSLLDYKGVTVPAGPGQTRTELVPRVSNGSPVAPVGSFSSGTPDDLIDHAITARQNFESQRSNLIDQLGTANRRQAAQITARLHAIDSAEHGLDFETAHRMMAAKDYNSQHDKELTHQRRADIDEQGAYLMSAIGNLDNLLHRGAIDHDDYNDGVLKAMEQYPMGIENPAAARHLNYTVSRADRIADFKERLNLRNAAKSGSQLSQKVEQDLFNKTGLTGDEFAAIPDTSVKAGKFVTKEGTEVPLGHVGGQFTNQYEGADKGSTIEIDTETGPIHMTRAAYNRYRRVFGSAAEETPASPAAGTAKSDMVRVKHPNGQVGSIPAGQLKDALSAGYTQVQ